MENLFDLMVSHFLWKGNVFENDNSFSQIKILYMAHKLKAKFFGKLYIKIIMVTVTHGGRRDSALVLLLYEEYIERKKRNCNHSLDSIIIYRIGINFCGYNTNTNKVAYNFAPRLALSF